MLAFLGTLFDHLESVSSSPWFYLVIFLIAFADSVFPVVPSETTVILGGIAAGQAHLDLPLVIACGAFGAILGDNVAYSIGRWFSAPIQRWYGRKEKRQKQLAWADRQLRQRGGALLLTARFIPGGRTVVTLSSGITRQRRLRFLCFVVLACIIWASYGAGLGYAFGSAIEDNHTLAFLVAFGTALTITFLIEVARHTLRRGRTAAADG
jgi:membrane protein DedA with SNARE-associated domain